jgi:hypothetical protein
LIRIYSNQKSDDPLKQAIEEKLKTFSKTTKTDTKRKKLLSNNV